MLVGLEILLREQKLSLPKKRWSRQTFFKNVLNKNDNFEGCAAAEKGDKYFKK